MWISKKKIEEMEKRITEAEQRIAKLDDEMHPTPERMMDAFREAVQYRREHPEDLTHFLQNLQRRRVASDGNAQLEKEQLKTPVSLEEN